MTKRIRLHRKSRLVLPIVVVMIAAISITGVIALKKNSLALSGSDFNAGRIIDDSVFYNQSTMTVAQIQSFLSTRVTSCDTNGTQAYSQGVSRAQYGTSRGYAPPYTCLKDYTQNVPAIIHSGSDLCPVSITTSGVKSAAQIIYEVAQSCRVNPQVLLVLLEKEQGLVTDTWPWGLQYRSATGYGCPDTAPCDSEYYGFFNQVFQAAQAYKRYAANPANYNYRSNRNNNVLFNPQASCGSSSVFITNQATANLYIYTPYQPNQAALNNLYGGGDGCSSYGNRNFWRLFRDWFGNTIGPDYAASIQSVGVFSDAAMTIPVPIANNSYVVRPSTRVYVKISALNIGRSNWDDSTSLGTSQPQDRISPFKDSSWLSAQRAAHPTPTTVQPNSIGTFTFTMTPPSAANGYSEAFSIVQDGVMWTGDKAVINFSVSTPQAYPSSYNGNRLTSGATLRQDQVLVSPDSYTTMRVNDNGQLEIRRDFNAVWLSPAGGAGSYAVMQPDGNFVLYNAANNPVWHTVTSNGTTSEIRVQEDGNVVLYNASGATWSSGTGQQTSHVNYTTTSLDNGGELYAGQVIQTPDRRYTLTLQGDGNLVLYAPRGATWASGTVGSGASRLVLQGDGNMVLYSNSGRAVWNSGTSGRGQSKFYVQGDGNMVLYGPAGFTWASWTN